LTRTEAIKIQTNKYIYAIENVELDKRSTALQHQLDYFKSVKNLIEEQDNVVVDKTLVQKVDVIEVIEKLKFSFYSFFPNIKDDTIDVMVNVWYNYLKKYKKIVLQDALDRLITTPSEYGKAPNLPDVVAVCESIRFDDKYKDKSKDL